MSVPAHEDLMSEQGTASPAATQVPATVVAAAHAAFSSRDPLSRTLALVTDFRDVADDAAPREDAGELVFGDVDTQVIVTASDSDASDECSISISGPKRVTSVAVEVWEGDRSGASPAGAGRWSLSNVPTGIFRVELHDERGTARTSWVRL